MHHRKTTSLLLCALFTALLCVSAFIRIPTPLVPITVQSGMVLLAGLLLGPKLGAQSVLCYLLLGLMGVPVFALGGGPGYVFQPTFGYLLGFVLGAFVTGVMAHRNIRPSNRGLVGATLAGLFVIYLVGTAYCYWMSVVVLGSEMAFWPLLVSCAVLPLPGDLALCGLAILLGKRLMPHTKRYISRGSSGF